MSGELLEPKQIKERQFNVMVTIDQEKAVNDAFKEWALDQDGVVTRNDYLREIIFNGIGRKDLAKK